MTYQNAPQVFHAKEDNPKAFAIYPLNLLEAIHKTCKGNEAKVLLVLLGCKGDGSFSPSTQYMCRMTGISKPNHYFETRKKLEKKGFVETDENGNLYIDIDRIMVAASI